MINRRKKIISYIKKSKKLYLFLKFIESIFQALKYYLVKIITHFFHNQIIKYSSKELQEKFFHFEIDPKTFFESVVCSSVVKRAEKTSDQEQEKLRIDAWANKSGLIWHNKTDNIEYQNMYFDEQSKGLILELNKILENLKNKKFVFL